MVDSHPGSRGFAYGPEPPTVGAGQGATPPIASPTVTALDMAPPTGTNGGTPSRARPDGGRRRLLAALATVIVLGATLGGWYWWSHPYDPISSPGSSQRLTDAKVGTTYYFQTGISVSHSVVVTAVEPKFGAGSALAATAIVVCGPGGVHIGSADSLAGCVNPRPLHELRLTSDRNGWPWILIAVTPITPGVVHIDSYRVVYRFHGTHSAPSGIDTKVHARV